MGLFSKDASNSGFVAQEPDEFTEEEMAALKVFCNIVTDNGYYARIAYRLATTPTEIVKEVRTVLDAIKQAIEDIDDTYLEDIDDAAMSLRLMMQIFSELDNFTPKKYGLSDTLLDKCERLYYAGKADEDE